MHETRVMASKCIKVGAVGRGKFCVDIKQILVMGKCWVPRNCGLLYLIHENVVGPVMGIAEIVHE